MELIKEFLRRYANVVAPDSVVRKALLEALADTLNIHLPERAIKIVNTVAYLEIDSTTKSVLFMRQEDILSRVEEKIGKRLLTAIR